jgi:hypothetical protein
MRALTLIPLLLWTNLVLAAPNPLEQALSKAGFEETRVTEAGDGVTVAFKHADKTIDEPDLRKKVITAMLIINTAALNNKRAALKIEFSDGEVIQVEGTPGEFRDGMGEASFLRTARVRFLTRGPASTLGPCLPAKRMSCKRHPDRCPCAPGHRCEPEDETADQRGCLHVIASKNVEGSGSKVQCTSGHTWDNDGFNCVPIPDCGAGGVEFAGACECPPGVDKNAAGRCGPMAGDGAGGPDGGVPDGGVPDAGPKKGTLTKNAPESDSRFPTIRWQAMAAGVVLSVLIALYLLGSILSSVRSKRSKIGVMKFCIHCGRKLAMEATLCHKCNTEQP